MGRLFKFLFFTILSCLLMASCDVYRSITPKRVIKNEQAISDLTNYMIENKLDSLSRKHCSNDIKRKLRKMRIHRIEKKPTCLYFSMPREMDTIVQFQNYGGFFHYRQTIYIIPSKLKEKYAFEKLDHITFKKINDTIYIGTTPFIAFM